MERGAIVAGRFEIEALAGTGGMGSVYRALDRHTGERVALKQMRGDAEASRFAREIELLADVRHPAIVRHVAHGTTASGSPWLAMEWLEGETLEALLLRGTPTPEDAIALVARLGGALAAAHERGVVHRDVKPSNVLLVGGELEGAKLLDFGIARRSDLGGLTLSGAVLGTPAYMAPEQARGDRVITPAADVFSLGCVLFECLVGEPAFGAAHAFAILARVMLDRPPPPSDLRPAVSTEIDALVARMLDKDPAARIRDGAGVVAAIAELGRLRDAVPTGAALLTDRERRVVTVIVGRSPTRATGTSDGAAPTHAVTPTGAMDRARRAALDWGGRLEWAADGSFAASFGGGVESAKEQAARAARCALSLRPMLPELATVIATGRAEIGLRLPLGEALDRAAARVTTGRAGVIALDEQTASLLDASFDVTTAGGEIALIGMRTGLEAPRAVLGRPTPFVGRERELRTLLELLDECRTESRARAVVITGAPGAGKSRLAHELLARTMRSSEAEAWVARADPIAAGSPLAMVAQVVRDAARVAVATRRTSLMPHGDRDARTDDSIEANLRSLVERVPNGDDAQRVDLFLGELIGLQPRSDGDVELRAARQDAKLLGDQMRRAFEEIVVATAALRTVVVVLDDLHWGDAASVSFVDAALRVAAEMPLLVVALGRRELEETFPRLWASRGAQVLRLEQLGLRASEALARAALDRTKSSSMGPHIDAHAVRSVVEAAAGNPFCIEELARGLAEGRTGELPSTVLAAAEARLAELRPDERRVLRAASVFGVTFWRDGVAALVGEAGLDVLLAELVAREVIVERDETRFPGTREHAFAHGLLREGAYAQLTDVDRGVGHGLAAVWLEAAGERDALVLAAHFERGPERGRAIAHLARAASEALTGDALDAVQSLVDRALACGATGEVGARLLCLAAEASYWRGEMSDTLARAERTLAAAAPGGSVSHRASTFFTAAASRLGDVARFDAHARALLGSPVHEDARSAYVEALARVAISALYQGNRALAEALLAKIVSIAGDVSELEPRVAAAVHQARMTAAGVSGDLVSALVNARAALEDVRRAGDRRGALVQRSNIAFVESQLGEYEHATETLRDVVSISERLGLEHLAASARGNLGHCLAALGATEEARVALERAAATHEKLGDLRMAGGSTSRLAKLLVRMGDHEGAERAAATGVLLATPRSGMHAFGLAVRADVELSLGRAARACALASEARAIVSAIGGSDAGEAFVRLVHAQTLEASGDTEGARGALLEADAWLTDRAAHITDDDLRARFLTRVPDHAEIRRSADRVR